MKQSSFALNAARFRAEIAMLEKRGAFEAGWLS